MEAGNFFFLPAASSSFSLFFAAMIISVVLRNIVCQIGANMWPWWPKGITVTRELILHLLGMRVGLDDEATIVVQDSAIAADALLRHADDFCDRPVGMGATSVISGGRLHTITTQRYGPAWVALRRNLTSEAFHPVRGLERAAVHRERALAALVGDIAPRSGGVVPVHECLYSALFALNMATCFGDDVVVDRKQIEAIRVGQEEFRRSLAGYHVFSTFQKVMQLVYWGRWKKLVNSRRALVEMYLPLIRARKERHRLGQTATSPSYVDTLLELDVPVAAGGPQRRRKLTEDEVVGLAMEYVGAGTETIVALLEWTLANLVLQPDIQSRLRRDVVAAAGRGEACCEYLRAVVMESLRRHPPFRLLRRQMSKDTLVGDTPVARGTVINIALEEIGRDNKIRTSPEKFIPERFMPGGEGEGVRLSMGSSTEAGKVMMMPFGAGPRKCPGMGNAILQLEYFLTNLVTAFEWQQVDGEEVDLQPHYGFFTIMENPLRARVVQLSTAKNAAL